MIDLSLFTLFVQLFREATPAFYIVIATLISRTTSLLVNYLLNLKFVFQVSEKSSGSLVKYLSLGFGGMLASAIIVTVLHPLLPINEVFIKIVVDIIIFVISYVIQRKYIFLK